jgi:uncharacterized membrane protein
VSGKHGKHQQVSQPAVKPVVAAAHSIGQQGGAPLVTQTQTQTQVYEGPVPHPDIMAEFDRLVPGAAREMFDWARADSEHRRAMEAASNAANISTQSKQLALAQYQAESVFRSDLIGQICGLIVSVGCVAGAVYLAVNGQPWVAAALAGIPTAAVIQAFMAKRPSHDPAAKQPKPK